MKAQSELQRVFNHPIGIVLLARLAVDTRQQGKGLGKALLFDALSRIEEAADIVAVRAVMVHAIDESARRFYEHFEFEQPLTVSVTTAAEGFTQGFKMTR